MLCRDASARTRDSDKLESAIACALTALVNRRTVTSEVSLREESSVLLNVLRDSLADLAHIESVGPFRGDRPQRLPQIWLKQSICWTSVPRCMNRHAIR